MKVIYSSFKIKEFALNVFKELYSYDQFKALETYVVEKVASDGATQFSLKDRNDSIQGCFLSPYAIVQKRNNPRQRWFEDKGFSIKNTEVFLSDQWYGDDRHNSTAILPLQYFVEMSYRNIYKIQNNSGEFKLIKTGDSMNNQEPIKVVSKNAYQAIFFGAPGTGKSFKVNSILGEERKKCFAESSEIAKSNHYADVLSKKEYIDCNIWIIDNIGTLEKKLAEFDLDDKRANPRHSALQAYIDFLKKYREENRELRTTFHPDYDYAQFVGAYKPKKELNETTKKEEITYAFVPQVFAKAYAAAWKLQLTGAAETNVFLVIEEINRGNCAQIFGDIFQLLDRDSEGFSQYSIDADCDFAGWLKEESVLSVLKDIWTDYEGKVGEGKLKLPPNLNILATMNTSDQSLFPMDSAFKRRFDWEYVPISFDGKDAANYKIEVSEAEEPYSWKDFVEKVNKKILGVTKSEDKQLGEFFIKPDKKDKDEKLLLISEKRFLGKVMFYLWNDVCKDEHENESFFRIKDDGYFTFQDLYKSEKKGLLKKFMDELMKEEG